MITLTFRRTAPWPTVHGGYRQVIAREFADAPEEPRVRLSVGPNGEAQVTCGQKFARRVREALEREFNRSEVVA